MSGGASTLAKPCGDRENARGCRERERRHRAPGRAAALRSGCTHPWLARVPDPASLRCPVERANAAPSATRVGRPLAGGVGHPLAGRAARGRDRDRTVGAQPLDQRADHDERIGARSRSASIASARQPRCANPRRVSISTWKIGLTKLPHGGRDRVEATRRRRDSRRRSGASSVASVRRILRAWRPTSLQPKIRLA